MTEGLNSVLSVLRGVRLPPVRLESEVVNAIGKALDEAGIVFKLEVAIAPGCRVDLLVEGGIAIEVKKGKPNARIVAGQVRRYASVESVEAVVLVSERGLVRHITEASGKPVEYVALSQNWGLTT